MMSPVFFAGGFHPRRPFQCRCCPGFQGKRKPRFPPGYQKRARLAASIPGKAEAAALPADPSNYKNDGARLLSDAPADIESFV